MLRNKIRLVLVVLSILFILSSLSEPIFLAVAHAGDSGDLQLGIMSYIYTNKDIKLEYAKSLFKSVNIYNKDEIEGIYSFYVDNYNTEDINLYITKEGLILAFYTDRDPASRMITWNTDKKVFDKLSTAIGSVGQYLGINIDYNDIKYYHYKYPEANKMLIVTQSVGENVDEYSYGNLKFNIPESATIYEISYSMYLNDPYFNDASIAIDSDIIDSITSNGVAYDSYDDYISKDTDHLLSIGSGLYAQAGVAMVVIYKDDGDSIEIDNADYSFDTDMVGPETSYNPDYTPVYTETPIPTPRRTPKITIPIPTTEITTAPTPIRTDTLKPKKVSIDLHGERTNIEMGQQVLLKGSIVSFNTNNAKLHAQVIIIPPSGFSVASADFVRSPAGQYASNFDLDPGAGKDIEVTIIPNEPGDFNVVSKITYYLGDDKSTGEYEEIKLPIKVREKGEEEVTKTSPIETEKSPGFGILSLVVLFIGLLVGRSLHKKR